MVSSNRHQIVVVLFTALCLLSVASSGAAAANASADGVTFTDADVSADGATFTDAGVASTRTNVSTDGVTFTGAGVASTRANEVLVWQHESVIVSANYDGDEKKSYQFCLRVQDGKQLQCTNVSTTNGSQRVELTLDNVSLASGKTYELTLTLQNDIGHTVKRWDHSMTVVTENGDLDGDMLTNRQEAKESTNMTNSDTDGDGLNDGPEVKEYRTDPNVKDTDGDGMQDGAEVTKGTDPLKADSDEDGLDDGTEMDRGTSPLDPDTDNDGLDDGREVELGTNPLDPDTDDDSLRDGREVELGTDPTDDDTDQDGFEDGTEVSMGTNPQSKSTLAVFSVASLSLLFVAGVGAHRAGKVDFLVRREGTRRFKIPAIVNRPSDDDDSDDDPDAGTGADAAGETESETDSVPVEPIETDRGKVLRLLREHNSRLRQHQIVDETGWSKSKVSRVLSKMQDDDQISKFQIGRENIVTLPGEKPDGVTSRSAEDEGTP